MKTLLLLPFGLLLALGANIALAAPVAPVATRQSTSAPDFSKVQPRSHSVTFLQFEFEAVNASATAYGGEVGASLLLEPFRGRQWYFGPEFTVEYLPSVTRVNLHTGIDTCIWIMNIVAPGFSADVTPISWSSGTFQAIHERNYLYLSFRLAHVLRSGALALRFGGTYDTAYQFGAKAGLTLQLDGVPKLTGPVASTP
ncbi:MAG: hypothetical protein ACXWP5_16165 [Bdellovibrionota bacterium]